MSGDIDPVDDRESRSDRESLIERFGRRVRIGLVGGGLDSVIGSTHRIALRADGLYDFVAGALAVDADIARATSRRDLLAQDRVYLDYHEMAAREAARDDGIDVVTIATPPQLHLDGARTFLRHGIDVICEKPMTADPEEAQELKREVVESQRLFMLTHCFSAYPMVRQARDMVAEGAIGEVKMVEAEFVEGSPDLALEPEDPETRHWRFRPESMGKAAVLGELGTHVHHLLRYVTGLDVLRVSANMQILTPRRDVYDNAYLTLELENGVVGRLWSTYIALGQQDYGFRIYGTQGSLVWRQGDPEFLWLQRVGTSAIRLARGLDELSESSRAATRSRVGLPEGYALGFANLYRDFAYAHMARALGEPYEHFLEVVPGIDDGVATLNLVAAAERSHDRGGEQVAVDPVG